MRWRTVEVEVVFLDVLAVVALVAGDAEEPLLEHGVALVPEGDRHAQVLEPVAEAPQPVLVPSIAPAASMVMGEVRPGISGGAIILPDRPPGALGDIGPPSLPVGAAGQALGQSLMLGGRRLHHGPSLKRQGGEFDWDRDL